MKRIFLSKLLLKFADNNIETITENGVCAGTNGPYMDEDTNVRNVAHWLIVYSYAFKVTQETKYKEIAYLLIGNLYSSESRPMQASFICRKNPEKDLCNGLMGQAWVIESLIYACKTFSDEDLYKLAEDLFLKHKFDYSRNIWHRLGVDGSYLTFDPTFNHQLWFCAVVSLLDKTELAQKQSKLFFDNIATKPEVYQNGVIYHHSNLYSPIVEFKKGPNSFLDYIINKLFSLKEKKRLYSKSVGYHGFNLYAYELLKTSFSKEPFFESYKYKKMVSVALTPSFIKELEKSKYSYGYNPPGFELGYALLGNNHEKSVIERYLNAHFKITSSCEFLNSKVSQDKNTSEARVYELVRIVDICDIEVECVY